MTPPSQDPTFERAKVGHPMRVRQAVVDEVGTVAPGVVRVLLRADDLHDLVSTGPSDHARVFFPDPGAAPGAGPVDVAGLSHRDLTPLPTGDPDRPLALDLALHDRPGPAARWFAAATPGAPLLVAGPKSSRGFPAGARTLLLVGDATALPALSRWCAQRPAGVGAQVLLALDDPATASYLTRAAAAGSADHDAPAEVDVVAPAGLLDAVRGLPGIDATTWVFVAGEAGAVADVRRHLRVERGLPAAQVGASGYWRTGVAGWDHHAPLPGDEPV